MGVACLVAGCKAAVPHELHEQQKCVLHFTFEVEQECQVLRRQSLTQPMTPQRNAEIAGWIAVRGELLARVATGAGNISDDLKARVLATFLTLMNLRESLNRAAARSAKSVANEK